MKKFVLAVFFDHKLEIGGNFQQSLTNILLAKKLISNEIEVIAITTVKENLKVLKNYGLKSYFYNPNFFSLLFMRLREMSSELVYKFISLFLKKNNLEKFLEDKEVDLIYFVSQSRYASYVHSINYIFTLFDLCHSDYPEFPEKRKNRSFEFLENHFKKNLPRAIAILVESSLGKKNVISKYRLNETRVHIFPMGPATIINSLNYDKDGNLDKTNIDIKKKYNLTSDYIFYPAQFWAHKNHIYILEALNILKKDKSLSMSAIFSGSDMGNLSYIKSMTKIMNLEDRVRFAGFVSDKELVSLYLQSVALVMPTYFGPTNIPPLEAFKLKVPVIYSDLLGSKEQAGKAALYLDLNDPQSLVLNLKMLLNSKHLREELINEGQLRLKELKLEKNNLDILKDIIKNFRSIKHTWKND
ncbi:glycosyltransferase family 4 protein [Candidatus Pelagibacter sp.]|jgi:glycosyltransferase involved in cell wall biosynthesis|nr:glycosyltransferase family 4 protein [Candidatus Pelagibacter sp.]